MSWNSLLWGHEPTCCVTGALGFAFRTARYMRDALAVDVH